MPLVDRLGRRPLLFYGIAIMFCSLCVLFVGFLLGGEDGGMSGGWATAVEVALITYVTGYQVGFGPITWVLIGEIFPLHSRARAVGSSVVVNFGLNLLTTLANGPLVDALGQATLFAFFAIMCLVSFGFVWLFVPETKGKTLEQIEEMLGL